MYGRFDLIVNFVNLSFEVKDDIPIEHSQGHSEEDLHLAAINLFSLMSMLCSRLDMEENVL